VGLTEEVREVRGDRIDDGRQDDEAFVRGVEPLQELPVARAARGHQEGAQAVLEELALGGLEDDAGLGLQDGPEESELAVGELDVEVVRPRHLEET
jgi:hypothetical protein